MAEKRLKPTLASGVERSSGNVFADIGLPDADELQLKVRLIFAINAEIQRRGLSQKDAALLLGVNQPKISALSHTKFSGFSVERLMGYVKVLGFDVIVTLKARPVAKSLARVSGKAA